MNEFDKVTGRHIVKWPNAVVDLTQMCKSHFKDEV